MLVVADNGCDEEGRVVSADEWCWKGRCYTLMHTHIHAHTRTHTYTHKHTHTITHTHTPSHHLHPPPGRLKPRMQANSAYDNSIF